jgi:hypothetical protein
MMRSLPITLFVLLILVKPVHAASPLDYTRAILRQASTIVGGNQTYNEKLAVPSSLFGKFLDTDGMGAKRSANIGRV